MRLLRLVKNERTNKIILIFLALIIVFVVVIISINIYYDITIEGIEGTNGGG